VRREQRPLPLWAVATTDPMGYVVAWMLAVVIGGTAVMVVDALVTRRPSTEPWSEVVAGVSLIVAVLYALLRSRAGRLTRLLEHGERVDAVVDEFRQVAQWVHLKVSFETRGRQLRRSLLLPSSRRTGSLEGRSAVTLAVDAAAPRRLVVADLYD